MHNQQNISLGWVIFDFHKYPISICKDCAALFMGCKVNIDLFWIKFKSLKNSPSIFIYIIYLMYQLLREVSRFSFRMENIHCHTSKLRFYKTVLCWQYTEVNDNVPSEWILSLISVNYASVLLNALFKPRIPFGLTLILLNLLTVGICLVCIFQSILIQFFCHCFLKLRLKVSVNCIESIQL